MDGHAICVVRALVERSPGLAAAEGRSTLVWLAWLYIRDGQEDAALDVLDAILESPPSEHATSPQEGWFVIHPVFMLYETTILEIVSLSLVQLVTSCALFKSKIFYDSFVIGKLTCCEPERSGPQHARHRAAAPGPPAEGSGELPGGRPHLRGV